MSYEEIPFEANETARKIVECAICVHRALGPGLLESVYEACLTHELRLAGIDVKNQVSFPVVYRDLVMESALRLDLVVNNCVVVELKAVETIHPVFEAQLLTYLKITGIRVGLLINFNVPLLKKGIKRIVV